MCPEQNTQYELALPEATHLPSVPSAGGHVETRAAPSRRIQPPLAQPKDKPRSCHKVITEVETPQGAIRLL